MRVQPGDGDRIRVELEEFELELLRNLPEGLRVLLGDHDTDDPAIQRLFPAAVTDDRSTDREVRELIFDDLLRQRLDAVDEVTAILERATRKRTRWHVDLDGDESALLLGVLNDLRLTLGARVGIEQLTRDDIDEEHPAAPTLAVMDHLAWFQEQLIRVLDPAVAEGDE